MATQDIGTGQTYTTRQAWEDALAGTLSAAEIADCLGEEFTGALSMSGHVTTSSFYMECRGKAGARHDGRRNSVSGLGNARVNYAGSGFICGIFDEHCRYSWMESVGPGNNDVDHVIVASLSAGAVVYIHHNLIGNDGAATTGANHGATINGGNGTCHFYFNFLWGFGGNGIRGQSQAAGSAGYNNTIYKNNRANIAGGVRAGIRSDDADFTWNNNAVFETLNNNFIETAGTFNYNAADTASVTGANSLSSRTTANEFVNPTTTYSALDLRLKSGNTLDAAGVDLSGSGLPDITLDITGTTISGAYPIGAHKFVSGGGGGGISIPVVQHHRRGVR